MSVEAKRSLLRILANYTRLVATLVLGLFLVRILLRAVGNDAQGMILLLGSTVGLAAMFEEIIRSSLVRELGVAYHSDNPQEFKVVLSSATLISALMALASIVMFAGVYLALPWLSIPDELLAAARWFLVARAISTTFNIVLAPQFNMLLISERMFAFHSYSILQRLSLVLAAFAVLWWVPADDPARGVIVFGWLTSIATVVIYAVFVGFMVLKDRSLIPSPSAMTRAAARDIVTTGGWNTCVVAAVNLHFRLDAFIMNLAFGLLGNLVFGLAVQMASYVRMIAQGMTFGADAVAARHASTAGDNAVRRFNQQSSMLHALVTFPSAIAMIVLCEPIMYVWLHGRIENPTETIPLASNIIRILMIGVACRSISDSWMRVLYGAGHVRRYVWIIILSGITNPIGAIILLFVLPESVRIYGVSWAYAATLVLFNGIWLGVAVSRILQMRIVEVYQPLLRPLIGSLVCMVILFAFKYMFEDWNLIKLALALGTYGGAYLLIAAFFVLKPQERARIVGMLKRKAGMTNGEQPE